jgi:hypothetical protein
MLPVFSTGPGTRRLGRRPATRRVEWRCLTSTRTHRRAPAPRERVVVALRSSAAVAVAVVRRRAVRRSIRPSDPASTDTFAGAAAAGSGCPQLASAFTRRRRRLPAGTQPRHLPHSLRRRVRGVRPRPSRHLPRRRSPRHARPSRRRIGLQAVSKHPTRVITTAPATPPEPRLPGNFPQAQWGTRTPDPFLTMARRTGNRGTLRARKGNLCRGFSDRGRPP